MKGQKYARILIIIILVFGQFYVITPAHAQSITVQVPGTIRVPQDVPNLQQAFDNVSNGGIIELAAGTYESPSPNGWILNNIYKGFTVRAAAGAAVVLSGGGTHPILRFQNNDLSQVKPITFDRIIFSGGYSNIEGLSGGLTLYDAKATFIDCKFFDNRLSDNVTTPGGAVYLAENSEVFFFRTEWSRNNAKAGGGAMGIRSHSRVYVHASQYLNNNSGNLFLSVGGAINLGNSTLRITNSRFDSNRAGLYGGAIYIIGNWTGGNRSAPEADVLITNSLFTNNSANFDSSSTGSYPSEGGAINVEDQSLLRVYNSRFINNQANIAGAINNFRAAVEVYGSVFLGNRANDTRGSAGFGGAISLNSNDGVVDGTDNKPNASLKLQNSWLQGRYAGTTTSAISGSCLYSNGDGPRIEDNDNIPNLGGADGNLAQVTITNTVFYECDSNPASDGSNKSAMGAIYTSMTRLTADTIIVANSDAMKINNIDSGGGAMTLLYNTRADIRNSTIAGNTATLFGGAIFTQGSQLNLTNSAIYENSVARYGSAIFSSIDSSRLINVTGLVENNTFSNNPGEIVLFDDDRNVAGLPYNDMRYNGNRIFRVAGNALDYRDSLGGGGTALDLNNLVINRSAVKVSTDKSTMNNNTNLTSKPVLGSILAAPGYILNNRAVGETTNPTAMVAYTLSGASGNYNSTTLSGVAGSAVETNTGTKTLTVGGSTFTTNITEKSNPTASFAVSALSSSSVTLDWNVLSGSFLDAVVDQDSKNPHSPSGSIQVNDPVSKQFFLYVVTEEGGFLASVSTAFPMLAVPQMLMVMVDSSTMSSVQTIPVDNVGGGTLNWTASTSTPTLIKLLTTQGQVTAGNKGQLQFTIPKNSVGVYDGSIQINSDAGSQALIVRIFVLSKVNKTMIPFLSR